MELIQFQNGVEQGQNKSDVEQLQCQNEVKIECKREEEQEECLTEVKTEYQDDVQLQYTKDILRPSFLGKLRSKSDHKCTHPGCSAVFSRPNRLKAHLNVHSGEVNFTDNTIIILCPHMGAVTYIDEKKNFQTYCFSTICENGCSAALEKRLKHALVYLPIMETRYKVNFTDNTIIILCPHMGAVTYIDEKKNFQTYCFSTICENGCSAALEKRLKHALVYLPIMETRYKVNFTDNTIIILCPHMGAVTYIDIH
ncbi:serine/threonine-protein kinase PLK1-like [Anabrus simplex]|uniref:serine/threonine-protein kinase PLK1-like n=1 Tax=Anabrus simplex TaxID=316456 RepID=UPI0035A28053